MREIKFRALTYGSKPEMVYGYYLYDNIHDRHFILSIDEMGNVRETRINPEPLGQYTGLKDKNGVDIYEGDVITNHGVANDMKQRHFTVVWVSDRARFSARVDKANMNTSIDAWDMKSCEVIGNIYENPELINSQIKELL